ncbi:GtrA family protein [Acetobacter sp. LMG 32666]|uniref:GtrA family protein n=1 Tax=Acetobacter sp. LMG 32666 TaxID=2959295 RepID=UPI0038D0CA34
MWIFIHYSHFPKEYCNGLSYLLATVYNYFLNFYWSFTPEASHKKTFWKYITIVLCGVATNTVFVGVTTRYGFNIETSAILFSFLWPVFSFTLMKLWAFKNPPKHHT